MVNKSDIWSGAADAARGHPAAGKLFVVWTIIWLACTFLLGAYWYFWGSLTAWLCLSLLMLALLTPDFSSWRRPFDEKLVTGERVNP